jgi:AraC family transcriptional regulator, transcriptional activator of pobA
MTSQSDYLDFSTDARVNVPDPVPTFYLYGEPHRSVTDNFLHVERLAERSLPAGWTIRPHSHRELNHLIPITEGGGVMHAEGQATRFEAPCVILIPAGIVHGFQWHTDSTGSVITLANSYRDELIRRDPDIGALSEYATVAPLSREAARASTTQARVLMKELAWNAAGHRTAVDAALAAILVQAVRALATHSPGFGQSRGRHAELVARFRALVEERFRDRDPIGHYAAQLGVSATTLRVACTRVTGKPPAELVALRAMLEAKRSLCYTNQSIAEIGYTLGFVDPAYFTRAFTRHAGVSPRRYRSQNQVVA